MSESLYCSQSRWQHNCSIGACEKMGFFSQYCHICFTFIPGKQTHKKKVREKELMRNKTKAKHIVGYEGENGLCHWPHYPPTHTHTHTHTHLFGAISGIWATAKQQKSQNSIVSQYFSKFDNIPPPHPVTHPTTARNRSWGLKKVKGDTTSPLCRVAAAASVNPSGNSETHSHSLIVLGLSCCMMQEIVLQPGGSLLFKSVAVCSVECCFCAPHYTHMPTYRTSALLLIV